MKPTSLGILFMALAWQIGAAHAEPKTPAAAAATALAANFDAAIPRNAARPTIAFGDGAIHSEKLQPYQNAWVVTIRKRDGTVLPTQGIWFETLKQVEIEGRKVFVWNSSSIDYRTQGFSIDEQAKMIVFSNLDILDAKTLAPIRSLHHFGNDDILRYSVDGRHVSWGHASSDNGPWETHNFDTPVPAYDLDGGFFAVFAPLLDLRVGNSGVLPGIGDKDNPLRGYPFRVVRKEKLRAGNFGAVETTVVEIYEPRTEEVFTFWVVDRPPYVLRFTVPGEAYDQDFEEVGFTGSIDWNFAR